MQVPLAALFFFAILTLWVPGYWPVTVFQVGIFALAAVAVWRARLSPPGLCLANRPPHIGPYAGSLPMAHRPYSIRIRYQARNPSLDHVPIGLPDRHLRVSRQCGAPLVSFRDPLVCLPRFHPGHRPDIYLPRQDLLAL